MDSQIIEKLKKILEPYVDLTLSDIAKINKSTHLINDLGLDSFYIIDLVIDIEKEFSIAIDDDTVAKFETVGVVIDIIKEKLEEHHR